MPCSGLPPEQGFIATHHMNGEMTMNHDLIRLAHEMRQCHAAGQPWRLPAMTVRELGILARLLEVPVVQPATSTLH